MELTEKLKLKPCPETGLILQHMDGYNALTNSLLADAAKRGVDALKQTSATVAADLPSCVKNQAIRRAKSMYSAHMKRCKKQKRTIAKHPDRQLKMPALPVAVKPVCEWNSQNNEVLSGYIRIPLWDNGKCSRHDIPVHMTDEQKEKLSGRTGQMRIVMKNGQLTAEVTYTVSVPEPDASDEVVMGVDLGIRCPAVSYISDGSIKFYGNGRKNRWMRLSMAHRRRKLQALKKNKAVRRISDKESRIMKDLDHKLSRQIVDEAVRHGVTVIRLEKLENIRSRATRESRKNNSSGSVRKQKDYNRSVSTWSFYRLAKFIEYKAELAGIRVEYVNPAYTSQRCPVCGELNKAEGRDYECSCGYHGHRDIVGAMNICWTMPDGSVAKKAA